MDIFSWVKEIEEVYQNLVENAKRDNLEKLREYTNQQEELLKKIHKKNNEYIESTISSLSEDLKKGARIFNNQINDVFKEIKNRYQKQKKEIMKKIMDKFGFDF
ncbi:MAG: hypothetical protein ACFFAS_19615 [Promethearchaeota archaeon]